MIVITSAATNIPTELLRHYGILKARQTLMVDGKRYEDHEVARLRTIETLAAQAREHPFVLGTSASELATLFRDLLQKDPEIVFVTNSRHVIGTYEAATQAVALLANRASYQHGRIELIDAQTTDVGPGLVAVFGAACAARGRTFAESVAGMRRVASRVTCTVIPRTLEYLVNAGRVSAGRAALARFLGRVPVMQFRNGIIQSTKRITARWTADHCVASALEDHAPGTPVWLAVGHPEDETLADAIVTKLSAKLDVRFAYTGPLNPGVYMNVGPGAVCLAVMPIDNLDWVPEPPKL